MPKRLCEDVRSVGVYENQGPNYDVTIDNCEISNNISDYSIISLKQKSSSTTPNEINLMLKNTEIKNNVSTRESGGLKFYGYVNGAYTKSVIDNCIFDNNTGNYVNRVVYQSGERIVMNDNITLFAYWVQEETGTPQPVEKPVEKTVYVPVYIERQSGSESTSQNDDAAQKKSFTVKYNANGGTGSVPVDKHQYITDAKVLAMSQGSLKRDNYAFAGWCISPNGNDSTYWPGHHFWISRNITLYALWSPVK